MPINTPGLDRFKRFSSLNTKLMVSFLLLGIVPLVVLGWYSLNGSADQLAEAAGHRLEEAAVTDGDMIDRNLFERYGDVQAFAANPDAQGPDDKRQDIIDFLTINYGIYDLMLVVDLDGKVLNANDVDGSGNSLDTSALEGRDVSDEAWFKVVASGNTPAGGTYYSDAHESALVSSLYREERLTLPFTAPIYDAAGDIVGIWHNEASFERVVSDIMNQRRASFAEQGLVTIETQVLRSDGVVLDDHDQSAVLDLNLVEAGLEAAALATGPQGTFGSVTEKHLRTGASQINGYAVTDGALGFDGYGWGILVRQDSAEAAAPSDSLRSSLLTLGAVVALVIVAAALFLARSISRPLKTSVAKLQDVSEGDLTIEFDGSRGDEVGQMATALNTALTSIGDTLAQVDHSAADLTSSAGNLTSLSREMSGAATDTSNQANEVASGAEQIAASSNTVANAMDQMSESVREISTNTAEAARMTSKAVEVSSLTQTRMEKLDASATDIGNVISVITSIAAQTDLLALNATIEAARVGEAGKGFAVVANEVKALAQQTSDATEEIQAKIEAIQSDAVGAVQAIAEISELIDKVNEISTTIAGAVEEQSATTAEVGRSIQAVTEGTSSISQNIGTVASVAGATKAGATRAQEAAAHLSTLAKHLNELLAEFKLTPSAGTRAGMSAATSTRPDTPRPAAALRSPAPVDPTPQEETQRVAPEETHDDFGDDLVPSGWR